MKAFLVNIAKNSALRPFFFALKKRQLRKKDVHFTSLNSRMIEFYQTIVDSGNLVFDIGANFGNRTKAFALIGAKVVAFEPQADCYEYLQAYFWMESNIKVVSDALGAKSSVSVMMTSVTTVLSTLSNEYIDRSVKSGRFSKAAWDGMQKVSINTFDNYIAKFGVPRFAKIDVEGFEFEVLKGLSTPIPLLSLEFSTENREIIIKCINKLDSFGCYAYQFSPEESFQLDTAGWRTSTEIINQLSFFKGLEWGDLYCQLMS